MTTAKPKPAPAETPDKPYDRQADLAGRFDWQKPHRERVRDGLLVERRRALANRDAPLVVELDTRLAALGFGYVVPVDQWPYPLPDGWPYNTPALIEADRAPLPEYKIHDPLKENRQ